MIGFPKAAANIFKNLGKSSTSAAFRNTLMTVLVAHMKISKNQSAFL
jgi:hypothetical protein